MLSKSTLKYLKSLQQKKYRKQHNAFIVEGAKSILELIKSPYKIDKIFVTEKFKEQYDRILHEKGNSITEIVTENDLKSAGTFKTNDAGLAVVEMLPNEMPDLAAADYTLVLDDIRDPGNLGSIIRIADWYGIQSIVCSDTSADLHNPKVIAASMGSFTRVKVYYTDLENFFEKESSGITVYGTYLGGEDLHKVTFEKKGVVLIGNESNGISPYLEKYVDHKITITQYGGAESLNAAMATAVVCDNVRRA